MSALNIWKKDKKATFVKSQISNHYNNIIIKTLFKVGSTNIQCD